MNCEQARELAALAASGDVMAAERDALELHNAGCAECRAEAGAFEALCGQLAAMRAESAPEHVYASVRARVAAEIGERRRSGWFTAWPAFVAAMAFAAVLVVVLHPVARVANLPVHHPAADHVVAAIAGVPDEAPVVARPPVRKRVHRTVLQEPVEPMVMKMFTDDPDVVIYWIADAGRQGSKKEIIQ